MKVVLKSTFVSPLMVFDLAAFENVLNSRGFEAPIFCEVLAAR